MCRRETGGFKIPISESMNGIYYRCKLCVVCSSLRSPIFGQLRVNCSTRSGFSIVMEFSVSMPQGFKPRHLWEDAKELSRVQISPMAFKPGNKPLARLGSQWIQNLWKLDLFICWMNMIDHDRSNKSCSAPVSKSEKKTDVMLPIQFSRIPGCCSSHRSDLWCRKTVALQVDNLWYSWKPCHNFWLRWLEQTKSTSSKLFDTLWAWIDLEHLGTLQQQLQYGGQLHWKNRSIRC